MTHPTGADTPHGHASSLSVDTCFDLLADQWRRHLLYYFADSTATTATVDELVSHLIKHDTTAATAGERIVTIQLRHTDLPKLGASGVIDYDKRDNTVQYHGGTTLEAAVAFAARIEQSP